MDLIAARTRALELAIEHAPNGTKWDLILGNAKTFADFLIAGKTPDSDKGKTANSGHPDDDRDN